MNGKSGSSIAGKIFNAALVGLTPFLLYALLKYFGARPALVLLFLLVIRKYLFTFFSKNREISFLLIMQAVIIGIGLAYFYWLNNPIVVKLIPPSFSASLFIAFGVTLFRPPSMIARFALMKEESLSREQENHCYTFTIAWSLFFLLNALFLLYVSIYQSLEWWLVATGPLSYALIGVLLAGEYLVRRKKFGNTNKVDPAEKM